MADLDEIRLPAPATCGHRQPRCTACSTPMRRHRRASTAGRLGARLRAVPPGRAADVRRGRRPPQRHRHHRRLDVAARRDGADKIFYTTGRLTSEMVIKSAQMGVPIVVSRSGITQMGYELARQLGLALFGRATNRHFLCYTGFERFEAQPEPARARGEGVKRARRCGPGRAAPSRPARRSISASSRFPSRTRTGLRRPRTSGRPAGPLASSTKAGFAALVPVADELDQPADASAPMPSPASAHAAVAEAAPGDQQRPPRP